MADDSQVRILFVDDEQSVLDGLSRALFHRGDGWDINTANSGREALEILGEEPYDVIVVDMRMPSMDGAELLRLVRERHPDTVRIVLSGHTEKEAALRVATLAHQFLAKPCSPDRIEAVVDRACELRSLLRADTLRAAVGNIKALPPVPRLYSQLSTMLDDPDAGIPEVSKLIESDPAMSAKTLQMVNSSFFTVGRTVRRVQDAVGLLGIRMMRDLALLAELFGGANVAHVSVERLEREATHCLRVATVARRCCEVRKDLRDDAFMAGILHDVGKLVLWSTTADWEARALEFAEHESIPIWEAETALFGAGHAEIGGYLLGVWGLPNTIVEAVAFHHRPIKVHPDGMDLLAAVHIANLVACGLPLAPLGMGLLGETPDLQQQWLTDTQATLDAAPRGA